MENVSKNLVCQTSLKSQKRKRKIMQTILFITHNFLYIKITYYFYLKYMFIYFILYNESACETIKKKVYFLNIERGSHIHSHLYLK